LDDLKWTRVDPRSTVLTRPSKFPSDQGVFKDNVLYLPGELKGRLNEEELDPLVASSLILHSDPKIRQKEILSVTGFMIVPFFLLIAVIALAGPLLEPGTIFTYISTIALLFSAFLILFGGGYLIARTQRSLVLASDKKASELVGKDSLLQTLKKLGEMNLPDQARLKKRKNYLIANYQDSYRPSIDERIVRKIRTLPPLRNCKTDREEGRLRILVRVYNEWSCVYRSIRWSCRSWAFAFSN
jgi:hypothetical protein